MQDHTTSKKSLYLVGPQPRPDAPLRWGSAVSLTPAKSERRMTRHATGAPAVLEVVAVVRIHDKTPSFPANRTKRTINGCLKNHTLSLHVFWSKTRRLRLISYPIPLRSSGIHSICALTCNCLWDMKERSGCEGKSFKTIVTPRRWVYVVLVQDDVSWERRHNYGPKLACYITTKTKLLL